MKIVIVEDNARLAQNLAKILRRLPGNEVLAIYPSAEEALQCVRATPAELFIVDIELPGASGIDLIHHLQQEYPHFKTLVWTIHEEREAVFQAMKAGASGYLLKGCSTAELATSLNDLRIGYMPMSPGIARRALNELTTRAATAINVRLSEKELEVLRGIAAGKSPKQIADEMQISPSTVYSRVQHTYFKLQARSREEAVSRAQASGLLPKSP